MEWFACILEGLATKPSGIVVEASRVLLTEKQEEDSDKSRHGKMEEHQ